MIIHTVCRIIGQQLELLTPGSALNNDSLDQVLMALYEKVTWEHIGNNSQRNITSILPLLKSHGSESTA